MQKLSRLKYVVFDVETTGLDADAQDRMVEIAAIKAEGERVIDTYHSFLNPGVAVSAGAFEVNKITPDMLENAPRPSDVLPVFMDFVDRDVLFAYNASFDAAFLKKELKLLNIQMPAEIVIIDLLAMSRVLIPVLGRYRLAAVAEYFGFKEFQKHRAMEDTRMSFFVLQKFINILKSRRIDELRYIKNLFCIDRKSIDEFVVERIAEIEEAINSGTRLKIQYISPQRAQISERDVIPRQIIRQSGKNYLSAYCSLRREERMFRIDGITHLEIA